MNGEEVPSTSVHVGDVCHVGVGTPDVEEIYDLVNNSGSAQPNPGMDWGGGRGSCPLVSPFVDCGIASPTLAPLSYAQTHALAHTLAHSLTHSHTRSLTHSHTHALSHSPTH